MRRLFSKKKSPPPPPQPVVNVPSASVPVHSPALQPKFIIPPVPHPRPHDHIAILSTKDALLLRPHISDGTPPESHVRISWGKNAKLEDMDGPGGGEEAEAIWSEGVVVYGIVGILELYTASYLLVITSISEVGHFFDQSRKIYTVKGVTGIPLVEDRARVAIRAIASKNAAQARMSLIAPIPPDSERPSGEGNPTGEDPKETDDVDSLRPRVKFASQEQVKIMTPLTPDGFSIPPRPSSPSSTASGASTPSSDYSVSTSPVETTVAKRLSFWTRLSQRTPTSASNGEDVPDTPVQKRQSLDAIIHYGKEEPGEVLQEILTNTAPTPTSIEERHRELEEKILRECIREFAKNEMYFAYNFDITRSLQHKQDQIAKSQKQNALLADLNALQANDTEHHSPGDKVDVLAEPSPTLPLWRRVDRQFWWNEWLSKPFIDAGLHSYVLPIVQGFFQFTAFPIPREPVHAESGDVAVVDYIIMSRRSRDRAGLRYQRRGIDDDARVANFVETETIMRVEREGVSNIFSYVQIRGSIPLFWTQSGYSLKPAPNLSPERTHEQHLDALRRHFQRTQKIYGPHAIVNLSEQHGKEAAVTNAYREYVSEVSLPDIRYCEYDFHAETKGMKYENISKLIEQLDRTFEAQGYLWISDNLVLSRQKGVFRVNCIDCLDRTNVVQSAFARYVLQRQLLAVALFNPSGHGRAEMDVVFNDVWANNGDAISRSYAGTSALKGDFTRTGKRDLGGLLNDGMNSLARMYTSTFSDWFSQAVIDYMLGYRTISVFSEFLLKLQSTDPRELIRLSKIRAEAIATSVSRVLQDGERLLSGWTLFAPSELNAKVGEKFEEKVLLLDPQRALRDVYDYPSRVMIIPLKRSKCSLAFPSETSSASRKACTGPTLTFLSHLLQPNIYHTGAYILSSLEETSCDPVHNAGFTMRWLNTHQTTRVTSYSMRNSVEAELPATPTSPTSPMTPPPAPRRASGLSRILSKAAVAIEAGDTSFAAFKALPIDPARTRRGSTFAESAEPADDLAGAGTCQEAVELMVDAIRRACEDVGNVRVGFVKDEDIVSLAEAQKMTSVYAKMEYGLKRLLWLGG
ncbi:hypothetical protein EVG20_g9178 [Dentipellis fragilis]|uniref:SAC domain-containing protein n=1 Tax=Dentipellis fragilis TaxID=205917 RepID=A0A4Y9Y175_9AGAM|nr:hypothetical protein EVG20_g9178 [Dentipellis fragilis]